MRVYFVSSRIRAAGIRCLNGIIGRGKCAFHSPPPFIQAGSRSRSHTTAIYAWSLLFFVCLCLRRIVCSRRFLARKRIALDGDPYSMRLAWRLLVPGAGLDLRPPGIYRIGRDPLDPVNYVVPWELSMTHCAARLTSNSV